MQTGRFDCHLPSLVPLLPGNFLSSFKEKLPGTVHLVWTSSACMFSVRASVRAYAHACLCVCTCLAFNSNGFSVYVVVCMCILSVCVCVRERESVCVCVYSQLSDQHNAFGATRR